MIEGGVLEDPHVDAIAMLHVDTRLNVGSIGVTPGAVNAAADEFYVTVRGSGGHGAYPHAAIDAIPAAAALVLALQNVVARETDPLASAVTERAEGNALFAEELVSYLRERGALTVADGSVEYDPAAISSALAAEPAKPACGARRPPLAGASRCATGSLGDRSAL